MKQRRLKTNFVINVIGTGLPIAVALITVPLYITHIGTARYGILAIVWILLGYFGFIDLGLSRASANALAKLAHASPKARSNVLMTSLYLNLALGIVGGLILYFSGSFLLHRLLTLSDPIFTELDAAFPWIAGMLPLLLLIGTCRGAIESKERFFAVNVIDLVGYVLGQILPLLAAILISPTLPVVLSAAFLARATSALITLSFVVRSEKIRSFRIFDRTKMAELIGFGAWASLTSIISPLLQFLDQLLVGSVLGVTAVAHYAVPMNLVARSQIVATALASAIFPRFSRISREQAIDLGESAVVSLGFVYGAMCASGILLSKVFMVLWIGPSFASEATPILEILLMGAWINGIAFIPFSLLQGQGRPDVVAKVHMLEIIPYVLLLWFMLNMYGVLGAAIAWSVRVAIDAAFLLKLAGFRARNMIGLILGFALITGSYVVNLELRDIGAIWAVCLAGLVFVIFVGFAITFDPNVRRIVTEIWDRGAT